MWIVGEGRDCENPADELDRAQGGCQTIRVLPLPSSATIAKKSSVVALQHINAGEAHLPPRSSAVTSKNCLNFRSQADILAHELRPRPAVTNRATRVDAPRRLTDLRADRVGARAAKSRSERQSRSLADSDPAGVQGSVT